MDISNILTFIIIGFIAQFIDGMLGMGYGVINNSFLLSLGIPNFSPALASASVHVSELFTTALSGFSHYKFGNVDSKIFYKLLIPGIVGGVLGAYILSAFPGSFFKPIVTIYLILCGFRIIFKSLIKENKFIKRFKKIQLNILGGIGGFFDAVGGGGWGPIVTTSLINFDQNPRLAIGSVNAAEFFVTVAESFIFFLTLGEIISKNWVIILGLLMGGVIAAPFAAYFCKKLPRRYLLFLVGLLIIILNIRTLYLLI